MLLGFPGICFQRSPNLLPATDIPAIFVPTNILKAGFSRLACRPTCSYTASKLSFHFRVSHLPLSSPSSSARSTRSQNHHSSHSHHTLYHNPSKSNNAFGCTCSCVPCYWHSCSPQTCSELCGSQRGWWFCTHERCGSTNDGGLYCRRVRSAYNRLTDCVQDCDRFVSDSDYCVCQDRDRNT